MKSRMGSHLGSPRSEITRKRMNDINASAAKSSRNNRPQLNMTTGNGGKLATDGSKFLEDFNNRLGSILN